MELEGDPSAGLVEDRGVPGDLRMAMDALAADDCPGRPWRDAAATARWSPVACRR